MSYTIKSVNIKLDGVPVILSLAAEADQVCNIPFIALKMLINATPGREDLIGRYPSLRDAEAAAEAGVEVIRSLVNRGIIK
jgi:hypothetical protein